jgi:hypothetical protein
MLNRCLSTLIILLAVLLTACTPPRIVPSQPGSNSTPAPEATRPAVVPTSESKPTPVPVISLTETDAGRTIAMKKGDTLLVTLEGNPSTGYNWEYLPSGGRT